MSNSQTDNVELTDGFDISQDSTVNTVSTEPVQEETVQEEPVSTEPVQEESVPTEPVKQEYVTPTTTTVYISLRKNAESIDHEIAATGQLYSVPATNGEIKLLSGRIYYIPISCDPKVDNLDSDIYSVIKVFSDIASQIEVRYVKNNKACIVPLKHNTTIQNKQRLCLLL